VASGVTDGSEAELRVIISTEREKGVETSLEFRSQILTNLYDTHSQSFGIVTNHTIFVLILRVNY
jgi:hypothetical protein